MLGPLRFLTAFRSVSYSASQAASFSMANILIRNSSSKDSFCMSLIIGGITFFHLSP